MSRGPGPATPQTADVPCPPWQVLVEALYFSLVAKRLHPEEDDTLVENPFVEHVSEKINKVRPPQGFALFQAKEEARKVKLLHKMLKVRAGEAGCLLTPRAAQGWLPGPSKGPQTLPAPCWAPGHPQSPPKDLRCSV